MVIELRAQLVVHGGQHEQLAVQLGAVLHHARRAHAALVPALPGPGWPPPGCRSRPATGRAPAPDWSGLRTSRRAAGAVRPSFRRPLPHRHICPCRRSSAPAPRCVPGSRSPRAECRWRPGAVRRFAARHRGRPAGRTPARPPRRRMPMRCGAGAGADATAARGLAAVFNKSSSCGLICCATRCGSDCCTGPRPYRRSSRATRRSRRHWPATAAATSSRSMASGGRRCTLVQGAHTDLGAGDCLHAGLQYAPAARPSRSRRGRCRALPPWPSLTPTARSRSTSRALKRAWNGAKPSASKACSVCTSGAHHAQPGPAARPRRAAVPAARPAACDRPIGIARRDVDADADHGVAQRRRELAVSIRMPASLRCRRRSHRSFGHFSRTSRVQALRHADAHRQRQAGPVGRRQRQAERKRQGCAARCALPLAPQPAAARGLPLGHQQHRRPCARRGRGASARCWWSRSRAALRP